MLDTDFTGPVLARSQNSGANHKNSVIWMELSVVLRPRIWCDIISTWLIDRRIPDRFCFIRKFRLLDSRLARLPEGGTYFPPQVLKVEWWCQRIRNMMRGLETRDRDWFSLAHPFLRFSAWKVPSSQYPGHNYEAIFSHFELKSVWYTTWLCVKSRLMFYVTHSREVTSSK